MMKNLRKKTFASPFKNSTKKAKKKKQNKRGYCKAFCKNVQKCLCFNEVICLMKRKMVLKNRSQRYDIYTLFSIIIR